MKNSVTQVSYLLPKEAFQERIIRVYLKQEWTQDSTLAEYSDEEKYQLKESFKKLCGSKSFSLAASVSSVQDN